MSEKFWWRDSGSFQPWKLCPSRPDPAEVLHFYLDKRNIEQDQYIHYLMHLLNLQKSMVYNILKGEGFETITRSRQLVAALQIYPPLLGLDAKYHPIEQYAYWWQEHNFPFDADSQGYPLLREVIVYLRMQRTQIEGGRVKMWSQEDLGHATGLKKETIYRMEHDKSPLILESMSRRAIVASALGTLAGENESTIFRLFGLDPQAYRVPVPECESVPVIHLPTRQITDDMLTKYQQQLAALFRDYSISQAQEDARQTVNEWVKQFGALMSKAVTTSQRIGLLALQSRSHRLLGNMAREQRATKSILFHTTKAIELAEQATALHNPNWGRDHALSVTASELLASALFTTALAYYELEKPDQAQEYIDRALNMLPAVQSRPLKTELLGAAALIHAFSATSSMDQQIVLSYIHQAEGLVPPSQSEAPDDNFFWKSFVMLSIYKAEALSSPHMKDVKAEKVLDILEDAQRLTTSQMIRQQISIEVLQAQVYFTAGEYQQATEIALIALEKCSQIQSRLNRDRIEKLFQQLLHTSVRDRPCFAYLGVKLRTWDHEID